jgi:hypothetical protein
MIRRAIGTTLAGLVALTGPLAGGAFAVTTEPVLTPSAKSARPGVAFTVSPTGASAGCPADSGVQTVTLTFTDRAGTTFTIGSTETADDGTWSGAVAQLPVAGLDAGGSWANLPLATGPGKLAAACFAVDAGEDEDADEDAGADEDADEDAGTDVPGDDAVDPGDDSADPGDDDATNPGDDDAGDEDSDDPGDGDSEDTPEEATLTYPGVAFVVAGKAPKLTLSAAMLKPGDSVTVSAGEGCVSTAVSQVKVGLIALGDAGEDADEAEGDDAEGDTGDGDVDAATTGDTTLPSATVTTSATGVWSAVTLALPAGTATGDYAVTAECSVDGVVSSTYAAAPVAVGTAVIGAAVCGPLSASVALTGTYSGEIAGKEEITLPADLKLTGDGPWKIKLRSATTGLLLDSRTVTCAKHRYDLDVSKTGLSDSKKPRVRACNAGRAPVTAVLKALKEKKYQKVDKQTLAPGECAWLDGSKLNKGGQAKLQVLIDAPGGDSDDVVTSFTVKRGKR